MSNVINLNKFRKTKARQQKRQASDENAIKFGRSKARKNQEISEAEKSKRDHDGHKLDE